MTSLAWPLRQCPSRRFRGVNALTGELTFTDCRVNTCLWCSVVKARRYVWRIDQAEPDALVTLTLAPVNWAELRKGVTMFVQSMRRMAPGWQWCWTVEANRREGTHLHGYSRGTADPAQVAVAARRSKFGRSDVREAPRGTGYNLKTVLQIPSKDSYEARWDLDQHLALNNGRLLNRTAQFWTEVG
jgi:hypothetical protein